MAKSRRSLRHWLQQIHLWTGLVLGVPLVLLGLTGSLLVYGHDLDHLFGGGDPPASRAGARHSPGEVLAAAIAQGEPGRQAITLRWPREAGDPATVRLVRAGGQRAGGSPFAGSQQVLIDPVSLQPLGNGGTAPGWLRFAHDLHGNLMLGRDGRSVVGWLGIAMLVLGVSGLVLWWPRSGQWKAAFILRRGAKGLRLHRELHGMAGIWSLIIFTVVSFTGVYLGFPQQTAAAINAVFPGRDLRAAQMQAKVQPLPGAVAIGLDAAIALAQHALAQQQGADAQFAGAFLPARPDQPLRLTLVRPGHEDGAPSVTVLIDPWRHSVIEVFDPRGFSAGETILAWQRGLHEGSGLGPVYRLLVFICGLLVPLFAITGFFMWWIKRRNRRRTELAKRAVLQAAGAGGPAAPAD